MIIEGPALVVGSNVDTDVIIPARYLTTFNPDELGAHCLEDLGNEVTKHLKPGVIIVAGDNFGCGSSREHAPLAIKGAGAQAVVARSFARIFLRNAINVGLPVFEVEGLSDAVRTGDRIQIDTETGTIRVERTGAEFAAAPIPAFLQEIIDAGGLIAYARNKFGHVSERER
jgi:3-isopropylmalate/(R)-2-methylmalate dehydratase small subunit